jgi:hypothetical protein
MMLPLGLPFHPDLVPPELLTSAVTMFGARMPSAQGTYMVKNGVSKCSSCNIVFYKEENYQIHKKYYCASRQLSDSEEHHQPVVKVKKEAREESKVAQTKNNSSSTSQQVVCAACGTKFSSSSTLVAHQAFYCTKLLEKAAAMQQTASSASAVQCPLCLSSLAEGVSVEEHLQVCKASNAARPSAPSVWQCPCCDFVTTSLPVAQCHLERHAGLQAFRYYFFKNIFFVSDHSNQCENRIKQ